MGNGGAGIVLNSQGNRIAYNVLKGNRSDGLSVGGGIGLDNLIEGNQIDSNTGCGIRFSGADNAYRDNMLRGNAGGAVCGIATDAGGNIL